LPFWDPLRGDPRFEKISIQMSSLIALFRLWQWKANYETKTKERKI